MIHLGEKATKAGRSNQVGTRRSGINGQIVVDFRFARDFLKCR